MEQRQQSMKAMQERKSGRVQMNRHKKRRMGLGRKVQMILTTCICEATVNDAYLGRCKKEAFGIY